MSTVQHNTMAGEFVKKLQSLDLHPKLERTFAVRTKSGAALSIGAILIATVLFLSELSWYFQVDKVETMEVDPVRGARMRINFDVTFPDMPCAVVGTCGTGRGARRQACIQ